jgi:hypothetical protein
MYKNFFKQNLNNTKEKFTSTTATTSSTSTTATTSSTSTVGKLEMGGIIILVLCVLIFLFCLGDRDN